MKMPSKSDDKQGLSVREVGRPAIRPPSGLTLQDAASAAAAAGLAPRPQPRPMPRPMPPQMAAPAPRAMPMKNGGSASSRADGIAKKGKTKGTMVMCGGGMAR